MSSEDGTGHARASPRAQSSDSPVKVTMPSGASLEARDETRVMGPVNRVPAGPVTMMPEPGLRSSGTIGCTSGMVTVHDPTPLKSSRSMNVASVGRMTPTLPRLTLRTSTVMSSTRNQITSQRRGRQETAIRVAPSREAWRVTEVEAWGVPVHSCAPSCVRGVLPSK